MASAHELVAVLVPVLCLCVQYPGVATAAQFDIIINPNGIPSQVGI